MAVPSPSCGMRDLQLRQVNARLRHVNARLRHVNARLQHAGSSVAACECSIAACGIQSPDQGSNPGSLHWEQGVVAAGPPGKSLSVQIFKNVLSALLYFYYAVCHLKLLRILLKACIRSSLLRD